MSEICPLCSLPKEICRCQELAKSEQRIRVRVEKRKWGREVTLVDGIDGRDISLSKLVSKLKAKCACGGSVKNGQIVLQGDHRHHIKQILAELGFPASNIDVT